MTKSDSYVPCSVESCLLQALSSSCLAKRNHRPICCAYDASRGSGHKLLTLRPCMPSCFCNFLVLHLQRPVACATLFTPLSSHQYLLLLPIVMQMLFATAMAFMRPAVEPLVSTNCHAAGLLADAVAGGLLAAENRPGTSVFGSSKRRWKGWHTGSCVGEWAATLTCTQTGCRCTQTGLLPPLIMANQCQALQLLGCSTQLEHLDVHNFAPGRHGHSCVQACA